MTGWLNLCDDGSAIERRVLTADEFAHSSVPQARMVWLVGAVSTEHLWALLICEQAAVMHEKATGAGELIRHFGYDLDDELFTGQVGSGQLEGVRILSVFDVDDRGLGPQGGQILEGVDGLDGVGNRTGSVVIGGHAYSSSLKPRMCVEFSALTFTPR
jgi:hypothetical protein